MIAGVENPDSTLGNSEGVLQWTMGKESFKVKMMIS
jgi:hypothetical protein